MKFTAKREVYIQPIIFKSISFHHQGDYQIYFELKYKQNQKHFRSAYPAIKQAKQISMFDKRDVFVEEKKCSSKTQPFKILYNQQNVYLKNGVSFIFQTSLNTSAQIKNNQIVCQLNIHLVYKQKTQKSEKKEQTSKDIEVGRQKLTINFKIKKDYSSYSSYRYILFTQEEYFSSLLLYIEFANVGYSIRPKDLSQISQLYQMSEKQRTTSIKSLKLKKDFFKDKNYEQLLQIRQLGRFYKFMINQRLNQYKRICAIYQESKSVRIIQQTSLYSSAFGQFFNDNSEIPFNLDHLFIQEELSDSFLKQRYQTNDKNQIYKLIYQDSLLVNLNLKFIWEQVILIKLRTPHQDFINNALKFKIDRMRYVSQFYEANDESIFITQKSHAQRIRNHKEQRQKVCKNSKFYNEGQIKHSMLTFHNEKGEILSNSISKQPSQILVILVHGYKGSERDMAKIKSYINTLAQVNFLVLKNLPDHIDETIQTLGKIGAEQIIEHLKAKPYIKCINIIGFSLGGIIARASLPYLSEHKQKFNLLLTFASPHLGLSQIQHCLVNAGLFWMKYINDIKNMKQLCIEPAHKKQSYRKGLISLSEHQSISWFKMIVLVGCKEDSYVPQYSALVAYTGSNGLIQRVQKKINQQGQSIDRISVWFDYKQGFMDKLTGRKGHISFLQDDTFLEYIFIKYLKYF